MVEGRAGQRCHNGSPGLTDSLVSKVNNPTSMSVAPDGRLFVAQKGGKLRVIKNGGLLRKPFLRLTTDTSYFRGLLGVAFDPNFSQNHYLYVFYTATSPTIHNRVSRFTASGNVAVAGSEKVILDLPPLGSSGGHYGGSLRLNKEDGTPPGETTRSTAAPPRATTASGRWGCASRSAWTFGRARARCSSTRSARTLGKR